MKRRPVLFTSAAVVGLWSAWIVLHGDSRVVAAATPARPAAPRPSSAPATAPAAAPAPAPAASDAAAAARTRLAEAPGSDAFAPREWFQPPPPPPPAPQPPPPPPAAPPPPPPPTLPYRFVGLLDEGAAARPRVFLALGEKLLVAAVGDTLEGGFRLTAISAQELVFEHVQSRLTLKLAVAAGAS